jgi:hypothetical protein
MHQVEEAPRFRLLDIVPVRSLGRHNYHQILEFVLLHAL